jgi:hypothetical protein
VYFTYVLEDALFSPFSSAANCLYFRYSYPETCGKTIEEIEDLFSDDGPHPWHTKPGGSKLDAMIEQVREKNLGVHLPMRAASLAEPGAARTPSRGGGDEEKQGV